jgi:hypothetical protein
MHEKKFITYRLEEARVPTASNKKSGGARTPNHKEEGLQE